MKDQAERLRELALRGAGPPAAPGPGRARVVAVAGGKEGLGTTSLAAGLGTALARRGRKVALLDAGTGSSNLEALLHAGPSPGLGAFLRGEARAEEVVLDAGPGLRLIPGASCLGRPGEGGGEDRRARREALASLTADRDLLLVDTAAGVGTETLGFCRAAGEVLLVTDAEPANLTDAYGFLKVLWGGAGAADLQLVVNRAADAAEGRHLHARLAQVAERFLGRSPGYLGHVERDECVALSAVRRSSFVAAYPRSPASRCVGALADALLEREGTPSDAVFWHRLVAGE